METFVMLRDDEIEAIKGYTKFINENPTNPHTPMMRMIRADEEKHLKILNDIIMQHKERNIRTPTEKVGMGFNIQNETGVWK